MMTVDAARLRVLYAPGTWADPSWLAHYGISDGWPPRLRNALLLRRAGARPVTVTDLSSPAAEWLAAHWEVLPKAVYVAGARLARDVLISRNMLLRLRHDAARFTAMLAAVPSWDARLDGPAYANLRGCDAHGLAFAAGMQCLFGAWPEVGPGWRDRLRLRLPIEAMPAGLSPAGPPLPGAMACRRLLDNAMMFCHAQNH